MNLREKINELGKSKEPFVFCINYDKTDGFAYKKDELPKHIKISLNKNNARKNPKNIISNKYPIAFDRYSKKLESIKNHIISGNIYMANLTCETRVDLDGNFDELFESSSANFILFIQDKLSIHSPEEFINIKNGVISTYPMKGTALFEDENSIKNLLDDKKELAEHTMVVDLLRNDLSMVSSDVKVDEFRYPVLTPADGKKLIQTVSKISGKLEPNYMDSIGDLLFTLLPAGSITGTPKKKCIEVLKEIECYDRGYYCGVFGEFDGNELKSAVAIRYIEKTDNGYVYKSGGGITIDSDANFEYEEMLKKVYIAF